MSNGNTVQKLIRLDDGNKVYLFLDNKYWFVADQATLDGVFGSDLEFDQIPELPEGSQAGPNIAARSALWQKSGEDKVYLVCTGDNKTYWIKDEAALDYYQFKGTVQECGNGAINDLLWNLLARGTDIVKPAS